MTETLTASYAKMFGSYSPSINEHKTLQFLPKTVQFCTKSASYDSSSKIGHYARKVTYCLSTPNSEGGLGTKTTAIKKPIRVKFQLEKECAFGDQFFIVGNDPILGSWNPSDAIPFNWSEGHIWSLLLELPVKKFIQYKFLLKKSAGEVLWQPGPDRIFQAWETENVIIVTEEWDDAEAQKISEENGESECRNLVEPSVLNSTENPKENIISATSCAGDLGSNENATEENKNGAYLRENTSSSTVKKSRNSERKTQKKDLPLRKTTKVDKNSAVIKDEGNLVTHDEGPVLVPGLTLLVSSSDEAIAHENQKSELAES